MRIVSWNINGFRAAVRAGLPEWLAANQPDVLCLQETRVHPDQLPEETRCFAGYSGYWSPGDRPGYSGVATFSREPATTWQSGFGIERFDTEGRVVMTEYGDIALYNVYFPNGRANPERLVYKLEFYAAFAAHLDAQVAAGKTVIFCGDVNTAHRAIDLARPKDNVKYSGFLPEERAHMDQWVASGWVDTFRHVHGDVEGAYSWWTQRSGAREKNIGWRLDYFFTHQTHAHRIAGAGIHAEVRGSDHCPVWLEISTGEEAVAQR